MKSFEGAWPAHGLPPSSEGAVIPCTDEGSGGFANRNLYKPVLLPLSSSMMPLPRFPNDSDAGTPRDPYYPIVAVEPDPVQQWLQQRDDASRTKMRSPLVMGAHRIRLAAERCRELQEQLDITRTRLLNAGHVEGSVVLKLEERAIKLATELHGERLGLWKDLSPLLEQVQDNAVDAMRLSWLESLANGSERGDGF